MIKMADQLGDEGRIQFKNVEGTTSLKPMKVSGRTPWTGTMSKQTTENE